MNQARNIAWRMLNDIRFNKAKKGHVNIQAVNLSCLPGYDLPILKMEVPLQRDGYSYDNHSLTVYFGSKFKLNNPTSYRFFNCVYHRVSRHGYHDTSTDLSIVLWDFEDRYSENKLAVWVGEE